VFVAGLRRPFRPLWRALHGLGAAWSPLARHRPQRKRRMPTLSTTPMAAKKAMVADPP
jgi:hypothetical protein